ncbi:DegT/DnrJ/EryC1/StrS family aminotransferase [Aestuariibacter halophilus]|uniref:DegT/DnrJ/EryC1/StrS family aminotransferase n=1 Tax=Fluctibacter halophilus TaxID=226011 RepID=A0ABS8G3I0_9ALTE|nr:DegT/DnrJ/EryC1/StrS family aminotransferase [Aestuariibacter halophilus]MCC2615137.1 DegT/DnrJ/EryC1/StrS family aminotransferase [Aestuariibacter halophilus]
MQFIDLQAQLATMRDNIDRRIATVLDHGQFIMGPEVRELEAKLADYVGVKHCISCANGTDALQLALMALDIGPGDTVLTTAFSFFATAEVIPLVGATPYFVDIEPDTYNMCPESLEKGILAAKSTGLSPKAVIAVDMFGLPANYPALQNICDAHGIYLIEDAAQGFGGAIGSRKAGSFGDIATTSFFPAKPLGCYGDGGAVFTDNDDWAECLQSLRIHGKGQDKYDNVRIGLNSRLDTLQAAVLLEKLVVLDAERSEKQSIVARYNAAFDAVSCVPQSPPDFSSAMAQYTLAVEVSKRDALRLFLQNKGIPSAIYYPVPLNKSAPFKQAHSTPTPFADKAVQTVVSLPLSAYMSALDIDTVIDETRCFLFQTTPEIESQR